MNKFHALKQLRNNGDSIMSLRDGTGILATIDFSTKYIRNKRYSRFKMMKTHILVFSWSDDKFQNIDANDIMHINPLSSVLQNKPPEVLSNG